MSSTGTRRAVASQRIAPRPSVTSCVALLSRRRSRIPESSIFGTLTMVFNHHSNDLRDKLDAIQHEHVDEIVSTVHVHLDEENCLEVVLMRGQSKVIRSIADALLGTKGVLHGKLVVTTTDAAQMHSHGHTHGHEHGEHAHTH